jgi:hypothetical protein
MFKVSRKDAKAQRVFLKETMSFLGGFGGLSASEREGET